MNTSAPFSPLTFAASVAQALGSAWSAAPAYPEPRQDSPADLTRDDGLRLWISCARNGRVEISLDRPRDASGSYPSLWNDAGKVGDPLITVNVTRSADAVAKDLLRRLLPDAERVHGLALAANAQADSYAQAVKRAEAAREAANAALKGVEVYASASGREVEFRAHVAPEKAEAFARFVAEFFKPSAH
jgi:hypothetical protein